MALLGKLVVLIFTVAFGIVAIFNTKKLAMFDGQGLPSARFWPIVCAVIVLILAAINIVEFLRQLKTLDKSIDLKKLGRVGLFYALLIVCSLFLSNVLGFFTAMALFIFVSLLLWNKLRWTESLPVSIGLPAVMWVLCAVILKMAQFPKGLFI